MFGHCKDCRWWTTHHATHGAKSITVCDRIDGPDAKYSPIAEADASVYADAHDDSGLTAGLKTGPMFGCAKFDPARASPAPA